jgi:hypothetical protein
MVHRVHYHSALVLVSGWISKTATERYFSPSSSIRLVVVASFSSVAAVLWQRIVFFLVLKAEAW